MKSNLDKLNKAFENRVRLAIMSVLMVQEGVDFNTLKEMLDLTDGNLASHASGLEKAGYLVVEKRFVGKKPHTTYRGTEEGKQAFRDHLDALEAFLKNPF